MPDHKIGTREDWQAARDELAKLEAEQAQRNEEVKKKRLELPWVPVEKEYEFDTESGKKTLAELFDGRSQLLAYNIMFGPDYDNGACPGCSNLADGLDGSVLHLNHRDVTLICFSRAPIERLTAYKKRMGWQFPYVSTYNTEFAFDFGLALTTEQAQQIPEVAETSSRSRKVAILAELLARLGSGEVAVATGLLSGVPWQGRVGVGYSTIYGVESAPAEEPSLAVGDLDAAIAEIQAATGSGSGARRKQLLAEL